MSEVRDIVMGDMLVVKIEKNVLGNLMRVGDLENIATVANVRLADLCSDGDVIASFTLRLFGCHRGVVI